MRGFQKFLPSGPPVHCRNCGQQLSGTTKSADEVVEEDGSKTLENLRVVHQPCGCVWAPGGFLTNP